jgi:SAM-dependent methyltransferase
MVPQPPHELISRVTDDVEKRDKLRWTFQRYAGLRQDEDVLDVGCGVGRAALALTGFLTGIYEGFDVDPDLIARCQQNITPGHSNFRFRRADVFNGTYNPRGMPASEFTFPYKDKSFDLVFGLSLFTHLLPADLERYLSETRRVLRADGRSMFTLFLLRPKSREILAEGGHIADRLLARDEGDYSTLNDQAEDLIAYRQGFVREQYERTGFQIREFFWGTWPQWAIGKQANYTQDTIVAILRDR